MPGRLPWAAYTLASQVKNKYPRSKWERVDGPDGLGVHRAIVFDRTSSKWLAPLLAVINDPRIATHELGEDGRLTVTFSSGVNADTREPFPLAEVDQVLND